MKTLIIYSHPNKKGHNGFILSQVLNSHKKNNIDYEIIDLYELKFNPLLNNKELSGNFSSEIKKIQGKITEAKKIIFIFPLWWNGVPAILKGFFDRVFISNYAFTYKKLPFSLFGETAKPIGLLTGKKAVIFSTSGSQKWTSKLVLGNRGYKIITKDILGFCGIKSKVFQIGGCKRITIEKKREIKKIIQRGLRWL